jgi:hypothetical protein
VIAEGIVDVRRSGPPLTAPVPTVRRAFEAIQAGRR